MFSGTEEDILITLLRAKELMGATDIFDESPASGKWCSRENYWKVLRRLERDNLIIKYKKKPMWKDITHNRFYYEINEDELIRRCNLLCEYISLNRVNKFYRERDKFTAVNRAN